MKYISDATRIAALLAVGSFLATNIQAQSFLANGLAAYYPFNGNANDATGNGNNGTVHGATLTADRFGNANQAYLFGGSSEYITVPCASTVFSNDFTVSVWVNASDYNNAWPTILSERGGNNGTDFTLQIEGQTSGGSPIGSLNSYASPAGAPSVGWSLHYLQQFTLNKWVQVVVAKSGSNVAMWLNGQIEVANTVVNPVVPPSSTLYIGTSVDQIPGSEGIFHGAIDDVRIYNRALSTNEIQQLYAYESKPVVTLKKLVQPSFSNLFLGTNYQLQVSSDLITWTNSGSPFTPTNAVMDYPQYWNVDNWNDLFFRLQVSP